jgi:hypothetical protein
MIKNSIGILFVALILSFSGTAQAQVCVWNMKTLQKAKETPSAATLMITAAANKMLSKRIVTVMDKQMTPSSGDKHDYMSMGRYWWPDPTKSDGLPYIRKDGQSNPEIEKLDRIPLSNFAKSVETLALAFYLTADEKYAQKAVDNLRIWFINPETKMNSNMNYGQTIPGIREGLGRGEGVLDTYSFLEMLDGVELLKGSKVFHENDQKAIKEWFVTYVNWLQTSSVASEEQLAKNNHGTAFDVQLARYAIFIGNHELAKKVVDQFASNRLFTQIMPNGAQPLELARTTAFGYSVFNLTHFLDMAQIAKVVQVDLLHTESVDGRSILQAIDFLSPFIGTAVTSFPYQQIKEWDEVQEKLCWQLYRVDQMLDKPLYSKYYKAELAKAKTSTEAIFY